MHKYQAYISRVKPDGITFSDDTRNSTKRQAFESIMSSSTLSLVDEMVLVEQLDKTYKLELKETKPSIVSDIDSFYKRRILFTPDTNIRLGSYIEHRDKMYLLTKVNDDDIYPDAEMEFCNYEFLIKGKEDKIQIGMNEFNKPKYEYFTQPDFTIPCVATSKQYSALDNSQMPLPTGAVYVYIPYHEKVIVPVNYEFNIHGDNYKVSSSSKINVLKDQWGNSQGYIEIRGQRRQNE